MGLTPEQIATCDQSLIQPYIAQGYCEAQADAVEGPLSVTPRARGQRTALPSVTCDPTDATGCLFPFPSNVSTVADPASMTGLRMNANLASINPRDETTVINRADGFSRVTPMVVGFPFDIDPSTLGGPLGGALRLFVSKPGDPSDGQEIPVRLATTRDPNPRTRNALMGYPLTPLEPATDYVFVVTDAVRPMGGGTFVSNHATRAALGLEPPTTTDAQAMAGYHAANVEFLRARGIELSRVLRISEFTTRSAANATQPLVRMREQVLALANNPDLDVRFNVVNHRAEGPAATVILGEILNVPTFRTPENDLGVDQAGIPVQQGTMNAPFRLMIPRGTGDYRMIIYGHGAGGDFGSDEFDEDFAEGGYAKLSVSFYGWTAADVANTAAGLSNVLRGAHRASAPLMDALAHILLLTRIMETTVDESLSAENLTFIRDGQSVTEPNPHVGRHLDFAPNFYIGGSLGGTMGLVLTAIDDRIDHGVMNVAGAAWSHWVTDSYIYTTFSSLIDSNNGGPVNVTVMLGLGQIIFDGIDLTNYVDLYRGEADNSVLIQESIGDPVLTNDGTAAAAVACEAVMVGAVLDPIYGVETAEQAANSCGITQYWVNDTGAYDVHGFATNAGPAASAAVEQMFSYVDSVWAGNPLITVPTGCPDGSCDFRTSR